MPTSTVALGPGNLPTVIRIGLLVGGTLLAVFVGAPTEPSGAVHPARADAISSTETREGVSAEGRAPSDADEKLARRGVAERSNRIQADGVIDADGPTGVADHADAHDAADAVRVWLSETRDCHRRGRRRFCDGPRRMPAPTGEALARVQRFGIGSREGLSRLLGRAADESLLAEVPPLVEESLAWPVPRGFMGRGFGYTREGRLAARLHRGVDIPAAEGEEVRATNAGLVVYADNKMRGYGNLVVLLHANDTRTSYAHLSEGLVAAGERVQRGQLIGRVGRTGLAGGPHLHFEWRRGALSRNPSRRFAERPTREQSDALQREQALRRHDGEVRLAEARARAARNQAWRDRAARASR